MQNYDNWLNANNPANEPDFNDYIASHFDGLCPVCNQHLDDTIEHTQCGFEWLADIEAEREIDRMESQQYDYY